MGEIADMMLDGTLDSETGEYIGPGPGYPRTLEGMPKSELNKKSDKVRKFLRSELPKYHEKVNQNLIQAYIIAYALSTDMGHKNMFRKYAHANKNFEDFKHFITTLHQNYDR